VAILFRKVPNFVNTSAIFFPENQILIQTIVQQLESEVAKPMSNDARYGSRAAAWLTNSESIRSS
jgi:hypothetical protein